MRAKIVFLHTLDEGQLRGLVFALGVIFGPDAMTEVSSSMLQWTIEGSHDQLEMAAQATRGIWPEGAAHLQHFRLVDMRASWRDNIARLRGCVASLRHAPSYLIYSQTTS